MKKLSDIVGRLVEHEPLKDVIIRHPVAPNLDAKVIDMHKSKGPENKKLAPGLDDDKLFNASNMSKSKVGGPTEQPVHEDLVMPTTLSESIYDPLLGGDDVRYQMQMHGVHMDRAHQAHHEVAQLQTLINDKNLDPKRKALLQKVAHAHDELMKAHTKLAGQALDNVNRLHKEKRVK